MYVCVYVRTLQVRQALYMWLRQGVGERVTGSKIVQEMKGAIGHCCQLTDQVTAQTCGPSHTMGVLPLGLWRACTHTHTYIYVVRMQVPNPD